MRKSANGDARPDAEQQAPEIERMQMPTTETANTQHSDESPFACMRATRKPALREGYDERQKRSHLVCALNVGAIAQQIERIVRATARRSDQQLGRRPNIRKHERFTQ